MQWLAAGPCAQAAPPMPDLPALAAAARALLPGCAVAATDPTAPQPPLWPGETPGAGATPARLREFAAGRAAARAALAALGHPPATLPMQAGRAPLWPPGIAGSLTHSATACLVAVTAAPALIGLDIEPDEPLPADLIPLILTATEDPREARLIFSAKETAWKAISALVPQTPGFDAMAVTLTASSFTATVTRALGPLPAGTALHGRHTRSQGHILTALTLPASSL